MAKEKGIIVELTDERKGIVLYADQKNYIHQDKYFIRLVDEEMNELKKENGSPIIVVKKMKETTQIGWLD